jgi:transposase-like protein
MPAKAMNLPDLIQRFGSEDKCYAYLEHLRWPDGVRCPRCESDKISRIHKRHQFDCDSCRYQFSVRVGTIFHDSRLPLWKWFLAAYMISHSKKGVSSLQLQRMIGVSYKTAWHLSHRIRAAMKTDIDQLLKGVVEVDETWVGGKVRGRGRGYKGNKALVVGAVQRGGKIRLGVIKDRSRESLHGFINKHVDDETEAIFTDDWEAYRGIADEDTMHETVNHSAGEYVRDEVHTNSVENIWSLLKRSVMGTYHHLSAKHLPAYLEEITFRFNNRGNPFMFRDTILALIGHNQLTFQELVG